MSRATGFDPAALPRFETIEELSSPSETYALVENLAPGQGREVLATGLTWRAARVALHVAQVPDATARRDRAARAYSDAVEAYMEADTAEAVTAASDAARAAERELATAAAALAAITPRRPSRMADRHR